MRKINDISSNWKRLPNGDVDFKVTLPVNLARNLEEFARHSDLDKESLRLGHIITIALLTNNELFWVIFKTVIRLNQGKLKKTD